MNGQFPPAKWNVSTEDGPRTNNNLESWHNKVKKLTGKNHLNIYEIVELLNFKLEQAATTVSLRQLMAFHPKISPQNNVMLSHAHVHYSRKSKRNF